MRLEQSWGLLGMNCKTYRLGDIISNFDKKRVPLSSMQRANRQGEYRYFGAQGVIDYIDDYIFDGTYMLVAEDGENLKSKKQNIAQIVSGQFWVNNHAHILQVKSDFNLYYLCYLINSMDLSGYITGSAQPKLSQTNLNAITVDLPEKEMQDRIASFLQLFDKKIETNEKINDNLAEQAQAFLCHFMDQYQYQLKPLSDIANVIDCLHSKKPAAMDNSSYQLIQLDNIRDDGFLDMSACKYMISQADYENWTRKCEIIEGDCVITNVGRIGAVSQAPFGTKAAMGRNMTCIRLKSGQKLHAYFITVLLSNHMRRQIQHNTDEGTIMGALNVKNIPKLLFPIFDSSNMSELENILYPLRKQIEYNNLQNQSLSQLRDTLLPKLMTGELDVSELAF